MRPIPGTVTDPALAPLIPKPIVDRDPGDENDFDPTVLTREEEDALDRWIETLRPR